MNKIIIILKKEIREIFRDKKSLLMMLIFPFIIPIILILFTGMLNSQASDNNDSYNKIYLNYEPTVAEEEILNDLNIDYNVEKKENLEKLFEDEEINAYITKEDNVYIINFDGSTQNGESAYILATNYLQAYKENLKTNYLIVHDIDIDELENLLIIGENNLEHQNFFTKFIVTYAFSFILMSVVMSAVYPSTDSTAGEKERGTLETLLTFPITSKDIIIGKYLATSLSALITGYISLLLSSLSIIYINNTYEIFNDLTLLNFPIIISAIIIITIFSFFISGLCIAIASKTKSFKEAQSALTPLSMLAMLPAIFITIIDIKSSVLISAIPFINVSYVFNEVANNTFNLTNFIIMIISTLAIIIGTIYIIIKQYNSEDILFKN